MTFVSYFELLVTGLVPLVSLCYYNCAIYRRIRTSARMKGKHFAGSVSSRQQQHLEQHGCVVGSSNNNNNDCGNNNNNARVGRTSSSKRRRQRRRDIEDEQGNKGLITQFRDLA